MTGDDERAGTERIRRSRQGAEVTGLGGPVEDDGQPCWVEARQVVGRHLDDGEQFARFILLAQFRDELG